MKRSPAKPRGDFIAKKRGWKTRKLEDVCQFLSGLWKGEKSPFVNVGVIRNTNFTKEGVLDDSAIAYLDVEVKKFEKRRLQFGDIILEKSGGGPKQPVGRVVLFEKEKGDFSFSNFTAALRVLDHQELDFRFLHKFLHWTYLSGVTEGMQSHSTGIRNLDGDAYKAIKISFPPLAEQHRIVKLLDEADELRELRTKADRRTVDLVPSLFHEMFGAMRETEKRWKWIELTNVANRIVVGHVGPTSDGYCEDGVPFLRTGNVRVMYIDQADIRHITADFDSKLKKSKLKYGDVVISRVGANRGMSAVIPKEMDGANCANIIVIGPGDSIDSHYLAYLLNSPSGQFGLLGMSVGSAQGVINTTSVKRLRIPLPPLSLQREFAQWVTEIRDLEANQATSRTHLDALFQSTLHRAFAGEL
jgi:type I restriction enzyme, S subunit